MKTIAAKLATGAIALSLFVGLVTHAAPAGDKPSKGYYGAVMIQAFDGGKVIFDGGTGTVTCLDFPDKNVIAVYNNGILDGGTSRTVFAGFNLSVSPTNGMPVAPQTLLSVDVTTGVPLCLVGETTTLSQMNIRYMSVR